MKPTHRCLARCAAFALLLTGCQSTVYLMPTPEALGSGRHDPFAENIGAEQGNRSHVVYATNRLPIGPPNDRHYLTLFDDKLRLGLARIRIGRDDKSWEALRVISTSRERQDDVPLALENTHELALVPTETGSTELPPQAAAFFKKLNASIAKSLDPDLTLFVHGANNNFYRASALASQIRHFSGGNSVVMLYAWPSAESILRYAVDVNNARASVPVFARLLELLARHSNARYIDILAYSAGAQIVSPALALLRQQQMTGRPEAIKERLRLGEIYFAAPDVDFRRFLDDMETYIDLPSHVTLAVNPDDAVLAFSAQHHGVSRAGRPDSTELTPEETVLVVDALRRVPFDVLWIDPNILPGMSKGAHDFWYSHPWVSTDVLVQLLFQARPVDRGLVKVENEGGIGSWHFPQDYPARITPAIRRLKAAVAESGPPAEKKGSAR